MRKNKCWIALVAVLIFLSVSGQIAFSEELNMQEGRWEMTTKMEIQGMPMNMMQPVKSTICLTKKDMVPQKPEKGQECKIINTKVNGNTVSWIMQCQSKEGTVESTGKITYNGDRFDGVINMTVIDPQGGKMQMTNRISGRRIGECAK